LISLLKLSAGPFASSDIRDLQHSRLFYSQAAAECAVGLLRDAGATAASVSAAAAAAAAAIAEGGGSSSSSLALGVVYLGLDYPPAATAPCDPLDQLPWAILYGRCCLMWAQQLQQELPRLLGGQQQQEGGGQQTWQQAAPALSCPTASWCLVAASDGTCGRMEFCTYAHTDWLEDPRVAERLSAAGYQPQQVRTCLIA
jgi:hypothetical protein